MRLTEEAGSPVTKRKEPGVTSQWEYKVVNFKLGWKGFDYSEVEEQLNRYGSDGWEMVSSMAPSFGAGQAIEIAAVLKRLC